MKKIFVLSGMLFLSSLSYAEVNKFQPANSGIGNSMGVGSGINVQSIMELRTELEIQMEMKMEQIFAEKMEELRMIQERKKAEEAERVVAEVKDNRLLIGEVDGKKIYRDEL